MIQKTAETKVAIDYTLASRWSPFSFNPNKMLSNEQIVSLCEAGRWAHSSIKEEPWRIIVCDREKNPEAFNKALQCIGEWNRKWAQNAPLMLIVCSDYYIKKKNVTQNKWAQYDTGACAENIALQATAIGAASHQIIGFSTIKTRELFDIPDRYEPMSFMAIGYQDLSNKLGEDYLEKEQEERNRRNIGDSFFDGEWGKAYL